MVACLCIYEQRVIFKMNILNGLFIVSFDTSNSPKSFNPMVTNYNH
jgi:hypothetical protein